MLYEITLPKHRTVLTVYLSDYNACSKLFLPRQQLNTVTRTQGAGFHLVKHLLNGFLVNLQQHNLLISPIS